MASKVVSVIQGEDKSLNLFLIYKDTKRPYSLVGATEIEVRIPKATGVLIKKLSLAELSIVGVNDLGHIVIPLTEAETTSLKVADGQAIFVQVVKGTDTKNFNKAGILNVAKAVVAAS